MATAASQKLSKKAQANVIAYLEHVYSKFDMGTVRERYERIDKAIQLESKNRREQVEDYYDDIEQSLLEGPASTISNFLIDTFVSTPSIFEVVTDKPELHPVAKQMNTINQENASTTAWARELILYFRDLPKYDFGGIEVNWKAQATTEIVNDPTATNTNGVKMDISQREGNELKRLDPYNTFWDTSVDINKVHSEGDYCGYTERYSMTRLQRLIDGLKLKSQHLMNLDAIWQHGGSSGNTPASYYVPAVNTVHDKESHQRGWDGFFGMTPDHGSTDARRLHRDYEVTTLYARIIPSMFGIKVPAANSVQIWKFVIVGWTKLLYAEKQTNIHNNLPTVLTQIEEHGIGTQSKSKIEKLIPTQNLSTKLYDIRVAGLVRSVSDRLLYDKSRISKADIDNDNPKAKIPVKPDILNPSIGNTVQRLEYSDTMGATFINELNFLDSRANKLAGLNNPQQGILQRGNRTLGEFNEVMQNADDDLRTWGKLVESQGMVPIKTQIKANILQYQPPATMQDPTSGEQISIDPVQIRQAMLDFKMADGLITRDMILDTQTARSAMELILQAPQLQRAYGQSLIPIVERIFSSIGFDLSSLRAQQPQPQAQPPAQEEEESGNT